MLQRIYGTALPTARNSTAYLARIEEAKKRATASSVASWTCLTSARRVRASVLLSEGHGAAHALEDYWREIHRKHGYEEIKTPIMLNRTLWERSGHWDPLTLVL